MDAFGDLAALTLHLARAERAVALLDDTGVRRGRILMGREIRVETADGNSAALLGAPRGFPWSRRTIRDGRSGTTEGIIVARPGRIETLGVDALVYDWPLLQLRAAIHEEVRTSDGRRRARILAAALGVRIDHDAEATPHERCLALLLYAAAMCQRIPPPSTSRYLVPRAL